MRGWKAPVAPFTPGSVSEAVKGLTVGVWLVGGRNGFGQHDQLQNCTAYPTGISIKVKLNTPIEGYPCVLMRRMIRQKLGTPAAGDRR